MGSYRTEGLGKAGREGWASSATVSVGTKSTEPGKYKGLQGSRKKQAADKRWVEELCEQQSGKKVGQRPRAKQREQGTRRQILAPTVLGTDSSASHVLDKSSVTEWQAQLEKVDTLLRQGVP